MLTARGESSEKPAGGMHEAEQLDVVGDVAHACNANDLPLALREPEIFVRSRCDSIGHRDLVHRLRGPGRNVRRATNVAQRHRSKPRAADDVARFGGALIRCPCHVLEELFEREALLDPSERGPEALVNPGPESEMAGDLAVDVEARRLHEHVRIEIGRPEYAAHERIGRQAQSRDDAGLGRPTQAMNDRALDRTASSMALGMSPGLTLSSANAAGFDTS